jgi:hypothetical protein
MARLSDVFFVPNQSDIAFVKEALRKSGVSEDEINAMPWRYFRRRIRRTVPSPKELEMNFNRLINLLAKVADAKTGKPLFGPKAWNLYKATLLHIRKGCLSDVPGLTYYVQIGEDSHDVPLFKCLRGTSALEGFHQKVRQLIRGFNISPRFAVAMLYEFVHRWNHDCDVRILGLPAQYANYYDGWELEKEIEVTCSWEELLECPHPNIECTKDFCSTEEDFGVVASAGDIEIEIAKVADAIEDGSWEYGGEQSSSKFQELTASAAWVADKFGRKRGARRVRTKVEREFYRKYYTDFQSTGNKNSNAEADNYTSILWGKFSTFWNATLKDEDEGKRAVTDMTYKTAFMLMEHYKILKKEGNASATLLTVEDRNKAMRRELRGPDRQTAVSVPECTTKLVSENPAAGTKRARVEIPDPFALERNLGVEDDEGFEPNFDDEQAQDDQEEPPTKRRAFVPNFAGRTPMDAELYVELQPRPQQAKKKRKAQRCRKCGLSKEDNNHTNWHRGAGPHVQLTGRRTWVKPEEVCTTPLSHRKENFPVAPGQRLPRI